MAIDLFGGGGGAGIPNQILIAESRTWTTPVDGKYLITAIGGGGAGGAGGSRRGGGAGGLAQSFVELPAGTDLAIVIGAGGTTPTTNTDGGSGGVTTVSGAGLATLTANGGAGGTTTGASLGGTATGGNIMNVQGGSAGDVDYSGGGAVGVYGVGYSSTGTGGAGTGGNGNGSTRGGALASISPNVYFSTTWTDSGRLLQAGFEQEFINGRFLCPTGSFLSSTSVTNARAGSGGATGQAGGFFAGGGGTSSTTNGGSCLFGGGGGGAGGSWTNVLAGAGGQGVVIIEWLYV